MENHISFEAGTAGDVITRRHPTQALLSQQPSREPSAKPHQAQWLGLMGLGWLIAGAALVVWMGEVQWIKAYIDAGVCSQTWVFQGIWYPSMPELLGVWMAGPGGPISLLVLTGAMLIGIAGLRNARHEGVSGLDRLLTMLLALTLPLLAINFTIASGIEFASKLVVAPYFDQSPFALNVWSAVAIGSAVAASLAIDLLVLRWAWRGNHRGETVPRSL